ncbi:hypothetical protein LTR84_005201 [Exophiala bonariae]|uniref:Nephrocystin 3-like N-terminal domain-containing protein n=1 Tax=Exophiala bonariae TaxID=1690606 RepID=A0AAV9NSS8_9EURO|nr:hypothetical protein LTR84_005201 [Exophiala bonariae]
MLLRTPTWPQNGLRVEHPELLDWLSTADFTRPQNIASASRAIDTGEWFVGSSEYRFWRDKGAGFMWLFGPAGCGKSVLCSRIISDLENLCKSEQKPKLGYWYFQFNNPATQEISTMLRSLIRQLGTSPLPPESQHGMSPLSSEIRRLGSHHMPRGSQPEIQETISTLDGILRDNPQKVFIVLDALDECPGGHSTSERAKVLEYLQRLSCTHHHNLRVLAISRPGPDIRTVLRDLCSETNSINIGLLMQADVKTFIKEAIARPELKRWGSKVTDQIASKLLSVEENLQIKRLQNCFTLNRIWAALTTLPPTLEATYHAALESIDEENREHVRKILQWLAFSFRELTLGEVAAITSFQFADDLLRVCTSLLVTIIEDDNRQILRLGHFSVQEFLVLRGESKIVQWYNFTAHEAHEDLALDSLSYLQGTRDDIRSHSTCDAMSTDSADVIAEEKESSRSFLQYAARTWPLHFKEAGNPTENSRFWKLIDNILATDLYDEWLAM